MEIGRRDRLAARDHLIHAGNCLKKGKQRRWRFEGDGCSGRGDLWRESDELDRVAEAAFAVKEDALAAYVITGLKRRHPEFIATEPGVAREFAAPFEMVPGFEEIATGEQSQGEIPVRIGRIG